MEERTLRQYTAVREKAGWRDRADLGRLAIRGADRFTWLQGMISADTKALVGSSILRACLLDATGHLLADLRLTSISGKRRQLICAAIGFGDEDFILLEVQKTELQKVASIFDRFLIMEEVEIVDATDAIGCVELMGRQAYLHWEGVVNRISDEFENRRPKTDAPYQPLKDPIGELYQISFTAETDLEPKLPCIVAYHPADKREFAEDCLSRQEIERVDDEVYELLRVESGVPRYGIDMDERTIALEAGLGPTHISFTKGCYVGQEVIARIDSRGHTNRALTGFLLQGDAPLPEPKAKLFAETEEGWKETGWLTSVIEESPAMNRRPIALGYARHEHRTPGMTLCVGEPGGVARVQATELPFFRGVQS